MKKLIGSVSCVLVMGCALALANANDDVNANNGTSDMNSQSAPSATTNQEPGTAADAAAPEDHLSGADKMKSESTTTTTTTQKSAMNKKSCTDENGKVILKGHTGFKACIKAKKDQMGGIVDESENKVDRTLDSNHLDNGTTHNDTSGSTNNQ